MQISRRRQRAVSLGFWVLFLLHAPSALKAADAPGLTIDQKEEFLRSARIIGDKPARKGVTDTRRVTLTDGITTHDANVQRIDEHKDIFEGEDGSKELNFKDTYKFNIAAWKLARLLGIDDMMPPYVEREYMGQPASFSWYVDNDAMDESDRLKKNLAAPNPDQWDQEMYVVRVFDQLIFNIDRNPGNLRIDTNWHIWMIDHSRSFRILLSLRNSKNLVECDRNLLVQLKALDEPTLRRELAPYLNRQEIKAVLARRDLIVKFFETKGDRVLYDRPKRS